MCPANNLALTVFSDIIVAALYELPDLQIIEIARL
jgi:hypothetical protein